MDIVPADTAPVDAALHASESLGRSVQILEDSEGRLDVTAAAAHSGWRRGPSDIPNFGPIHSVVWVRLTLVNSGADRQWLLAQRVPLIDDLRLFERTATGFQERRVGLNLPFAEREIRYRYFLFRLDLPPGQQRELLLRFSNEDVMTFDLAVVPERRFAEIASQESLLFGLYFGIMLVMILYNFFVYLSARDRSYRSYIILTALAGLFALSQNGFAYQFLWPDVPWLARRANGFIVSIYILWLLAFTRSFLSTRQLQPRFDLFMRVLMLGALIMAPLPAFMDFRLLVDIVAVLGLASIATMLVVGVRALLAGLRSARFFVLGFAVYLVGASLYALKTLGAIPNNIITHYGLQLGSVMEVVLFSLALADRINYLRESLSQKVDELGLAKAETERSARKYQSLVENTADMVFALSTDFRFLSANRATRSLLGLGPDRMIGTRLQDWFAADGSQSLRLQLLDQQLQECVRDRGRATFRAELRTGHGEQRELELKLEYIDDQQEPLLLGRASALAEDTMSRFIFRERRTLLLDNYLINSEVVSERLTRNVARYLDAESCGMLRLCLREMLINAIEHGNLSITFDEKTRLLEDGHYMEFLIGRQRDPSYGTRRVRVQYSLTEERVLYMIRDEGRGFDHTKMMTEAAAVANRDGLFHGRGIMMTLASFDLVRFNGTGNQVLLVKNFPRGARG